MSATKEISRVKSEQDKLSKKISLLTDELKSFEAEGHSLPEKKVTEVSSHKESEKNEESSNHSDDDEYTKLLIKSEIEE